MTPAKTDAAAVGTRLDDLVAATPATRDRYVDFLRAASIGVVVLAHWLSTLLAWTSNGLTVRNAVGIVPGLWSITWILQVMPVFFFIGGFSNYRSLDGTLRRGEPVSRFLKSRLVRLLKPTAAFVAVWLAIAAGMRLGRVLTPAHLRSTVFVFGPLWFLAVYLAVTALAPITFRLHRRFGVAVLAALGFGAAGVDVLRLSLEMPMVGWANMAFVWLFVHQLGYFYADGRLARASQRVHLTLALSGLAGLLVLTNTGVYPRSMVSTGFERASNMSPPTICILALTVWLVGAAMYLRRRVSRWLARPGLWKAVVAANSIIMTVYLWHLTAYLVVFAVLALFGFAGHAPGTAGWWLERPFWLVGPGLVLALLVIVFSRFERPTLRPFNRDATRFS